VSDVITDISGSSMALDGGRVHWGMMQVCYMAAVQIKRTWMCTDHMILMEHRQLLNDVQAHVNCQTMH
jgi:hypothetical protein